MEDAAAGFIKPCIADIKIGRQTWDPFSSPEKRLAEDVTRVSCMKNYKSYMNNLIYRKNILEPKNLMVSVYLE